jgi:hypothetical protein
LVGACILLVAHAASAAGDPFADVVVSYVAGANPAAGYTSPSAALGSPERFTGEGFFPSVVSPFSPPFLPDEIVSIGAGGSLVVKFDEPVVDDPGNPFGIDLLVFGNSGFIDGAYPKGFVDGIYGNGGGVIEVSQDGEHWTPVVGAVADGLFPTLGWLDAGPFDDLPGRIPSDFTKPVDPALALRDLLGLDYPSLVALYDGSGGGAGINLAGTGLSWIAYVRISVPADAVLHVEIDAFAAVASTTPASAADLNHDGVVDGADLGLLLAGWGPADPSSGADLDGSGTVDGADLGLLLAAWGD